MQRRHVLVSGPSGAGKSALTWLAAAAAADRMRWYQITGIATSASAEAISRFVRSRRPTATSPLALVFDEVGSANSDLWDALARELRGIPELYLLGSLRREDVNLISNRSDTGFVSLELDDELARAVWERLAAASHTRWTHWREPYEQSQGLMLEYIHLLTQGRRLALVIDDQVRQREREHRDDELGIIRSTAVLCARGGEVHARRLFELLGLDPASANRALRSLIDEHLVRESRPGVLGGLHALRSDALVKASHDETVFHASESLWNGLAAATVDSLPRVVRSLLTDADIQSDPLPLRRIASVLASSRELDRWTAILTGLGLATLDRHVISLMSILDRDRIDRGALVPGWRVLRPPARYSGALGIRAMDAPKGRSCGISQPVKTRSARRVPGSSASRNGAARGHQHRAGERTSLRACPDLRQRSRRIGNRRPTFLTTETRTFARSRGCCPPHTWSTEICRGASWRSWGESRSCSVGSLAKSLGRHPRRSTPMAHMAALSGPTGIWLPNKASPTRTRRSAKTARY